MPALLTSSAHPVENPSGTSDTAVRHRRRRLLSAFAVLAGLTAAPTLAQGQEAPGTAAPGPAVQEQRFQDWTVRCAPQEAGQPKRCEMIQVVRDPEGDRPIMAMVVGYGPERDRPLAWFVLPLGTLLQPGAGVRIDQGEPTRFPMHHCNPDGCLAPWPLAEADEAALKRGSKVSVAFQRIDGKQLNVPVSLSGFTAALDAIK